MIKTRENRAFVYAVYISVLVFLLLACYLGDESLGRGRWSLPFRGGDSLIENIVYYLNYVPSAWPLLMGVTLLASLLAITGGFLYLARPVLYIGSLMLYYLAYGEVDSAVTFLLFAQLLLFTHVPERRLQRPPKRSDWYHCHLAWWRATGALFIPIGTSIYYGVWFVALAFGDGFLAGHSVERMLAFAGSDGLGAIGLILGFLVLLAHLSAIAMPWLKKGSMVAIAISLSGALVYTFVAERPVMGLILGISITLARPLTGLSGKRA